MGGVATLTLPANMAAVTEVRFYLTLDRTGAPLVAQVTGGVTGDLIGLPAGRYYPRAVAGAITYDLDYLDLPEDPSLVVSAESVAVRARLPLPIDAEQRTLITDAIRDAQDDVSAFLGRAITPQQRVEIDRYAWAGGWDLPALGDDPLIRIVSTVPDFVNGAPSGYFTVTYLAGLDGRNDPGLGPIRRYVRLHTLNSPEVTNLWRRVTNTKGEIKSLSAEGQSVSWATPTLGGGGEAGSGKPGALPTLSSLDRWRVAGRRVYQAPTRTSDWPFTGRRW